MATTASSAAGKPPKPKFGEVIRALRQPRVALMLALGFSSGLPFMLTAATFSYWLREEGTSLKAIGFISWVGLAYSFKFVWAPIVERVNVPLLGRLGRRRGWMLLTQILVALSLLTMAALGVKHGLVALGAAALFTAVAAATQDIAIDAFRIEAAESEEELGLFTGSFQLGYRIAVLVADSAILFAANHLGIIFFGSKAAGWPIGYVLMAVLMGVGVFATLKMPEAARADAALEEKRPLWSPTGFFDAVVGPFILFFKTHGAVALLMLLMIILYRLPEFVMGPMATPFYHDLGFSKDFVGGVRLSAGLAGTLAGLAVGGFLSASLGYVRGLIVSGLLEVVAIAGFALPALLGPSHALFAFVMFLDNFGVGAAGVALVVYMSSLTSLGYTATQYALLSSAYTWIGKVAKGFTGLVVEGLQAAGHPLMEAYAIFFVGCGLIGLPAVLLCIWLGWLQRSRPQPSELSAPSS
ncbi:MAG: MFS transporter [Proteobacteria bacterium]|nr:MFS transporter [Pseudomonadota bacterium]